MISTNQGPPAFYRYPELYLMRVEKGLALLSDACPEDDYKGHLEWVPIAYMTMSGLGRTSDNGNCPVVTATVPAWLGDQLKFAREAIY